jgi:hypothetical protein
LTALWRCQGIFRSASRFTLGFLCLKPLGFLSGFPSHFARTGLGASSRLVLTLRTITFRFIRFEKPKLTTKTLLFHQARLHGFNTLLFPFERTLGQELNERLLVE